MRLLVLFITLFVLHIGQCGVRSKQILNKEVDNAKNKCLLYGCGSGNNNDKLYSSTLKITNLVSKLKWNAFTFDSRIKLTECHQNSEHRLTSSKIKNRTSEDDTILIKLKKKCERSGTCFRYFKIYFEEDSADLVNSNSTDDIYNFTLKEMIVERNFGKNFNMTEEKTYSHTALCFENASLSLQHGFAFGYCGEMNRPSKSFQEAFEHWKNTATWLEYRDNTRILIVCLVGILSGLMVFCIACCICCRLSQIKQCENGFNRGRRGSNFSSSGKTKEINI